MYVAFFVADIVSKNICWIIFFFHIYSSEVSLYFDQVGHLVASLLSPIANKNLGVYGCYGLGTVLYIMVLTYLLVCVKPVPKIVTTLSKIQSIVPDVSMVITDCSETTEPQPSSSAIISIEKEPESAKKYDRR